MLCSDYFKTNNSVINNYETNNFVTNNSVTNNYETNNFVTNNYETNNFVTKNFKVFFVFNICKVSKSLMKELFITKLFVS
jgi:hypothetical protein